MLGAPPDGDEQLVAGDGAAVVEREGHRRSVAAGAFGAHRLRADDHVDAFLLERGAQLVAGERFEVRDEALAALDHRHLARAETLPRLRHLDADDAAAQHHESLGHVLAPTSRARLSHTLMSRSPSIGGITALDPVASTTARRASSSRTVPSESVDVDPALTDQACVTSDQGAAGTVEPLHLTLVVPVPDDLVPSLEHRVDVELAGDRRARPRHPRTSASTSPGRSSTLLGMHAQ